MIFASLLMFGPREQELSRTGQRLNELPAVMAVPMHAIAGPLVARQLLVVALPLTDGGNYRHLACGLASHGIHPSTEHDAEKQQQSRKASNASQGCPKYHPARRNSGRSKLRHSSFG